MSKFGIDGGDKISPVSDRLDAGLDQDPSKSPPSDGVVGSHTAASVRDDDVALSRVEGEI